MATGGGGGGGRGTWTMKRHSMAAVEGEDGVVFPKYERYSIAFISAKYGLAVIFHT
jgi:hypothetical protein